jgi:hypothetical protein
MAAVSCRRAGGATEPAVEIYAPGSAWAVSLADSPLGQTRNEKSRKRNQMQFATAPDQRRVFAFCMQWKILGDSSNQIASNRKKYYANKP